MESSGREHQTILETGTLTRRRQVGDDNLPYTIRLLDPSYLTQILTLQSAVVQTIREPDLFAVLDREHLEGALDTSGRIVGACVGDDLAGYVMVFFPGERSGNLGHDLAIPSCEHVRVAHLESGVVHPDYRGNLLALRMNQHALRVTQSLNVKHLCATAWPNNVFSIRVLFSTGMVIRTMKEKYGGKLRYIFHRNLHEPLFPPPGDAVTIETNDLEGQYAAFANGLCGYALQEQGRRYSIVYGRPAPLHL